MSRMVSFKASDDEAAELEDYARTRHFRDLPALARFAIFAYMRQNRPGGHRSKNSAEGPTSTGRTVPPLSVGQDEGQP